MTMVSEHRMPARLAFPRASTNVDATPESPLFAGVSSPNAFSSSDSPSTARARQSKILDRWAAQQAQGIITSIERQAHEAELSALTTNVRASSLIQMWRGMEADGGGGTPTSASCGGDHPGAAAWDDGYVGEGKKNKKVVVVRCDVKEVVERDLRQRKEELQKLAGVCAVSRFAHRKRIQAFLTFRALRRDVVDREQRRSVTTTHELDQLQRGFTILTLRQRFMSCGKQQDGSADSPSTFERNTNSSSLSQQQEDMQFSSSSYSLDSEYSSSSSAAQQTSMYVDNEYDHQDEEEEEEELGSERQQPLHDVPLPEDHPPPQSEESEEDSHKDSDHLHVHDPAGGRSSYDVDLQEGSQKYSDGACWEEDQEVGSLEMISNINWERVPVQSSSSSLNHHHLQDVINDRPQTYRSQEEEEILHLASSSFPPQSWLIRRQAMYNDLLETYADNAELRQLLERRTVSTHLASDFRVTLDQLIMSALQRQGSTDGGSSEYEYEMFQSNNIGSEDSSQDEPSFSLVAVSSSFQEENHNSVPLEATYSSQSLQQPDLVQELRSDIARLNQEMCELRQLFQSCMEKQDKFQHSVKHDVTDVLHNLVGTGEKATSKQEAPKKVNCCICYEKKIDSLLYRCGHMCTCFRCAHELQWNSGRCPICRAPIVDVVRAYPPDA